MAKTILTVGSTGNAQFPDLSSAAKGAADDTVFEIEPGHQHDPNLRITIAKNGWEIVCPGSGSPLNDDLTLNPNYHPATLSAEMSVATSKISRAAMAKAAGITQAVADVLAAAAQKAAPKSTASGLHYNTTIPVALPDGSIYKLPARWSSAVSKGIIHVTPGVADFYIDGHRIHNAFGPEANAAIIRGQGFGMSANRCYFSDGYSGFKTGNQYAVDPAGTWQRPGGAAPVKLHGWVMLANSIMERFGHVQKEHVDYFSPAMFTVLAGSVLRGFRNKAHGHKAFGGMMFVYDSFFDDPKTTGTVIDLSSGPAFVVDSFIIVGTSRAILHRNERVHSPIGNALVVRGNTIVATGHNNGAMVATMEYQRHKNDGANLIGAPLPTIRDVSGNLCVYRIYPKPDGTDDGQNYGANPFIDVKNDAAGKATTISMAEAVNNVMMEEAAWLAAGSPIAAKVLPVPLKFDRDNWRTNVRKFVEVVAPQYLTAVDAGLLDLLPPAFTEPLPELPEEGEELPPPPPPTGEDPVEIARLTAALAAATQALSDEQTKHAAELAAKDQAAADAIALKAAEVDAANVRAKAAEDALANAGGAAAELAAVRASYASLTGGLAPLQPVTPGP